MTRRQRWLIALGVALFCATATTAYVRSEAFLRLATPIVANQIGVTLGAPVSIDRIIGERFSDLSVLGLTVYEPDGTTPIVKIARVRVEQDLSALWGRNVRVTNLEGSGISLHIRADENGMNVDPIIERMTADDGGEPSIGIYLRNLRIDDARIAYEDVSTDLSLLISNIAIDSPAERYLDLSTARLMQLSTGKWEIELGDGRQTINSLTASGAFNSEKVALDRAAFQIGESLLNARGAITYAPTFDLTVDGAIRIDDIRALRPVDLETVHGTVTFNGVRLTGDPSTPKLDGDWRLRDLVVGQLAVAAFTGKIEAILTETIKTRAQTEWLGGTLDADVTINAKDGGIELSGAATDLSVAAVRETFLTDQDAIKPLTGRIDGTFQFSQRDEQRASTGTWTARQVRWEGKNVGNQTAYFTHDLNGDRIQVTGSVAGASLAASGSIPAENAPLNARVTVSTKAIAPFANLFQVAATGAAKATATVSGTAEAPRVQFDASLTDAVALGYPIQSATAKGAWADAKLVLDSLTVASNEGTANVSGSVSLPTKAPIAVDLTGRLEAFDLAPYAAVVAQGAAATGLLNGEFRVAGKVNALDGGGSFQLTNTGAKEVAVEIAPFRIDATNGLFRVPEIQVGVGGATIRGNARFDSTSYGFNVALSGPTPLRSIVSALPQAMRDPLAGVDGILDLHAEADATFASPTATLTATLNGATYRSADLGRNSLELLYDNGEIRGRGAASDGAYALSGQLNLQEEGMPFTATVELDNTNVLPLIQLVGTPAGSGIRETTLDGSIIVRGLLNDVGAAVASLDFGSLRIASDRYALESVRRVEGTISARGIELNDVSLQSADPDHPFEVSFAGLLDLDRPIDFTVDAKEFDLAMVSEFLGLPELATGVGTYRLKMGGTARNPEFTTSWRAPLATVQIAPESPRLMVRDVRGRASYADKLLTLDEMTLSVGGSPVEVRGNVPFGLTFLLIPLVEQLKDAPLHLTVSSDHDDLSWLRSLNAQLVGIEGGGSLELDIAGTLNEPVVTGELGLQAQQIQLTTVKKPIDSLAAIVTLRTEIQGGRTLVADVTGSTGIGGGIVSLSGSARYPLSYDAFVKMDATQIVSRWDARLIGLRLSDALDAVGQEPSPIEAIVYGDARVEGRGIDPKVWRATARLSDVALVGNGRRLVNDGDIALTYRDDRVAIDRCVLGVSPSRLSLTGFVTTDGVVRGSLSASQFDVGFFGGFVPPSTGLEGRLTTETEFSGTLSSPKLSSTWSIENIVYDRLRLTAFNGATTYDGDRLRLIGWRLQSYGNELTLDGAIPLAAGWKDDQLALSLREEPMALTCYASGFDLAFASVLTPAILESKGSAEIDIAVEGLATRPYLTGNIVVPNGEFVLAYNGMRLQDVAFDLSAQDGSIDIERMAFRVGNALYDARDTRLAMTGLVPMRVDSALYLQNASAEAWLPASVTTPQAFTTLFDGTMNVSVDLEGLRNNRTVQTALDEKKEESAFALLLSMAGYLEGDATFTKTWTDTFGYRLRNDSNFNAVFENGKLTIGKRAENSVAPGEFVLTHQLKDNTETRRFIAKITGTWQVGEAINLIVNGDIGTTLLREWIAAKVFTAPESKPPRLEGGFRYAFTLTGTEQKPKFDLRVSSQNLAVNDIQIEGLLLEAAYDNDLLRLKKGQFRASGNKVDIVGSLPFRVAILGGELRPLDQDIQLQVDSQIVNFDFVPLFFPTVARAEGTGRVRLTIGGTFDAMRTLGAIEADHIRIEVPSNNLLIEDTSVRLVVQDDEVLIRDLSGRINGGQFDVSRTNPHVVRLERGVPKSVDVTAALRNATFYEPGEYRATVSGSFRFAGAIDSIAVTGEVIPSRVEYLRDWDKLVAQNFQSKSRLLLQNKARFNYPVLRGMRLNDVAIQAPGGIFLDTGNAKIEATIDGKIIGPLTELVFQGEVRLMEGRFTYRERVFQIERGSSSIWNTRADLFNPNYRIVASTVDPLRNVTVVDSQGASHRRDANVTATLTGTLEQAAPPELVATVLNRGAGEDYQMTPEQIAAVLTVGDANLASEPNQQNLAAATESLAVDMGVSLVTRDISRRLGLDLDLDYDSAEPGDTRVQFTKELASRFQVSYSSTLQLGQEQRIEIDYQMNRNISISGERNEEGKYGVDLKLEYEFR
ncbi:MAG: translocation/assembly module TamB domain-containing protein [Candidatus Poribacteria bacterium]|nr:translocation/assembly module TamB domain-containing protein [Candidatus Poribacteria bacterium]